MRFIILKLRNHTMGLPPLLSGRETLILAKLRLEQKLFLLLNFLPQVLTVNICTAL